MANQRLGPMSVGQILDQTFKLYRMNFVRFVTIVAVAYVPIGLIGMVTESLLGDLTTFVPSVETNEQSDVGSVPSESPDMANAADPVEMNLSPGMILAGLILAAVGGLLSIIAYNLCTGAMIKSISESYLGNEVTVGQVYRFVWPKVWTIVWAGIIVGVVVGFGFLLLVVPGVIFALWYALTTSAIVIEDFTAVQGMKRSKALVSGNLGKVFGVGLVVFLISIIISGLFEGGGALLASAIAGQNFVGSVVIGNICSIVGSILALPITAGAMILLYYDLRIRKEGFDLEMLAKSFGSGETA